MANERRPAIRRFWEEKKVGDAMSPLWPPAPEESRRDSDRNWSSINRGRSSREEVVEVKIPDDGGALHQQQQGSSELKRLPYSVEEASFSCPDGAATSLMESGIATSWKGGAAGGWVLLKLREKSLLSFLRVRNRATSEISISISVKGKRRRDFVKVKRSIRLAHEHLKDVKIGHLPCLYIRVECRSEAARGVSLYELAPVGIPAKIVGRYMGPSMEDLTYKSTERLLFGPSLRTSLARVCPAAALERLALPPSYLRPPTDTDVRRSRKGTRRRPAAAAATGGYPFHGRGGDGSDDGRDVGLQGRSYHSDGFAFPDGEADRGIPGPATHEHAYSSSTSAKHGNRGREFGSGQVEDVGRDAGWHGSREGVYSGSAAVGQRERRQERGNNVGVREDKRFEAVGSGDSGDSSRQERRAREFNDAPPGPGFLFSARAKELLRRSGSGGRR